MSLSAEVPAADPTEGSAAPHAHGANPTPSKPGLFASAAADVPAGLVVFLVALPLCLGIAQASGAPLLAGMIAGAIGGLVVGALSGSQLSVSGPAAGLAVLVAGGIQQLGFAAFLLAVALAGVMQFCIGAARLGVIAHYFPNAVIKGMLAAIGVLIVLKQLPHAVGYDKDYEGDEAFFEQDGHNTFTAIFDAFGAFTPGAIIVTACCALLYWLWPKLQRGPLRMLPVQLIAVVGGGLATLALAKLWPEGRLSSEHLVALPELASLEQLKAALHLPDFSKITDIAVWKVAATLALVASIETLLSLEAIDRLDPLRRMSPPNRELMAQGVGNLLSGMIGGVPVTSVIVRSSANVQAGGRSRLSTLVHGLLLVLSLVAGASLLNNVPLAALAVVLIVVGIKLSPPTLWRAMWRAGPTQFVPFATTVLAVVFTDLLTGTLIGLGVGVAMAIRQQQAGAVVQVDDGERLLIRVHKDLSFLNKAQLKQLLSEVPDGRHVLIDRRNADLVDDDIEELLLEFEQGAANRGISVQIDLSPRDLERRAKLASTHA